MRSSALCARLAALTMLVAPASAQTGPSLWNLNGSEMYLSAHGSRREFRYHTVRSGLQAVGVHPGALAFMGTRSGNQYSGVAYVFSKKCLSFPYRVTGLVSSDGRIIILRGRAPIQGEDCMTIAGYRDAVDEFHYIGLAPPNAGETKNYGDDGRLFSSGRDDYFLLSRIPQGDIDTSDYIGQVRVVHHFESGGYEILMKDYSVTCAAGESPPSVIWFKAGDHSTPVTVTLQHPERSPGIHDEESYNLYWAACLDKFRKFR